MAKEKTPGELLAEEQAAHQLTKDELAKEQAAHQATKEKSLSKIGSLQAKVAEKSDGKGRSMPTGELEGKKYRARYPKIRISKRLYTAEEVMASPALMAELVKNKSSFMIDVEAEKAKDAKKKEVKK